MSLPLPHLPSDLPAGEDLPWRICSGQLLPLGTMAAPEDVLNMSVQLLTASLV